MTIANIHNTGIVLKQTWRDLYVDNAFYGAGDAAEFTALGRQWAGNLPIVAATATLGFVHFHEIWSGLVSLVARVSSCLIPLLV